ncbi:hypothetical protein SAMN05444157_0755 [Frankineae bacterium MT45]|nr:hypothetical protein SAMN05444157_0755 [Frankineae bacterium MT45]
MKVAPPGSASIHALNAHAGDLFTDRNSEARVFDAALATFRSLLDDEGDAGTARRNALVFYGVGGVGKSTLSARLQSWAAGELEGSDHWGAPPKTHIDAAVRIDLHRSAGQVDMMSALIALRDNVSRIRRKWPVFDLAFAAYWSAIRPGQSLPTFDGRDELNSAVSDTISDLLGDIGSVVSIAGAGTGAGLGIRAVNKLIGEIRRRRDLRLALRAFDGFESFLLRCAQPGPADDDLMLATEIAGTLSWEIAQIQPSPLVVVFLDTTERLHMDPRRAAEGYVNSLVHQMPNVLFVMTGRNKMKWHDETRTELPYRGIWTWPGLNPSAQEEPRQHRVGDLSPSDARSLILRARAQSDLPISDEVVAQLVTASRGLPQYIELARQVAISIKGAGNGRVVKKADVTGSLGTLVQRVLDDIPLDEQRAVRASALFRTCDVALIAAAADVDRGAAERAVLRPMIERHAGERFPYRMHDAIRDAIRHADYAVENGWSESDWERAATRAAAEAQHIHDDAKRQESHREVLDAIAIAISLACDQDIILGKATNTSYEDWLSQAIVYGPSVQGLLARIPTSSSTEYGRRVLEFVSGKSIQIPMRDRLILLRTVFDSNHPLRLPAGRHLGYALKLTHRWEEALAVFDELVAIDPSDVNSRQRPLLLSTARRFADAQVSAGGTDAMESVRRTTEYAHGLPNRYFIEVEVKLAKYRKLGRHRELLEELGDLLVRQAFFDRPSPGPHDIDAFMEQAELSGHVYGMRCAMLAKCLSRQGTKSDLIETRTQLDVLDRQAGGMDSIGFRYAFAEICDSLISGERQRLRDVRTEIEKLDFRTRSWIPLECFMEVAGFPLTPTPTQWLQPEVAVRTRWRDFLNRYLIRHGSAPLD